MQIPINYKCNVHKSEAYRREQAGMWQGSSARNVGMSVKIYGCCACTVGPNNKNPPKIRLENSCNWQIIMFLKHFDIFWVHAMTGNWSYMKILKFSCKNSWNHFGWEILSAHYDRKRKLYKMLRISHKKLVKTLWVKVIFCLPICSYLLCWDAWHVPFATHTLNYKTPHSHRIKATNSHANELNTHTVQNLMLICFKKSGFNEESMFKLAKFYRTFYLVTKQC